MKNLSLVEAHPPAEAHPQAVHQVVEAPAEAHQVVAEDQAPVEVVLVAAAVLEKIIGPQRRHLKMKSSLGTE